MQFETQIDRSVPVPVSFPFKPLWLPRHRLWIFPAVAGTAWFLTLAVLLLTWLACGMPQYPDQSNPYVAFISDIASFQLKPFFIIGSSCTAICFILTVVGVHIVRYEEEHIVASPRGRRHDHAPGSSSSRRSDHNHDTDRNPNLASSIAAIPPKVIPVNDNRSKKILSGLTIFAAIVAGLGLILLGLLDTFRFNKAHQTLLLMCLAGLAFEAAGTSVLYVDEVGPVKVCVALNDGVDEEDREEQTEREGKEEQEYYVRQWTKLKIYATNSFRIVLAELILGATLVCLTIIEQWRAAGILGWITAFLGAFYMLVFVGFLRVREKQNDEEEWQQRKQHDRDEQRENKATAGRQNTARGEAIQEQTPLLSGQGSNTYS